MDWMALDTNWEMQRGQKRRVALFDETRISTSTRSNFASHSFQKTSGKVPCHEAFCFHYIFTAAGLTHTGIIVHSFKGQTKANNALFCFSGLCSPYPVCDISPKHIQDTNLLKQGSVISPKQLGTVFSKRYSNSIADKLRSKLRICCGPFSAY